MAETETNKTEEATPFKLKRAREKGTVARGADLGFFSTLVAFAIFILVAGAHAVSALSESMRRDLTLAGEAASDPQHALAAIGAVYQPAFQYIALLGATIAFVVILFEIIQIRGVTFSMHPLKPDFGRLNPATGLKRLFSFRMLKETAKNIVKMAAYALAAYLAIHQSFMQSGQAADNAASLVEAMRAGGLRLIFTFAVLALIFAALDQIIARGEFRKQMRMSKSELTREIREREGEPRLKQKRKQLHAQFTKQVKALGALKGSDMLIVNPQHYAVGLVYEPEKMSAPKITTKGRNRFALLLKDRAAARSIPIFEYPELARTLYRTREQGEEISPADYRAAAGLYLKLARTKGRTHADA